MSEDRIRDLLSRMTLEEKAGQLHQAAGPTGLSHDEIRAGLVGSMILNVDVGGAAVRAGSVSVEDLNAVQRLAVNESRLGIPVLFARDVIHGFRSVLPIPLGQAATWDPALVREGASTAASEARRHSIHWTFSPMLDIARDARWGRVAEGYGEDPFLASRMAEAVVRGYREGNDPILCCAKHFAGYSAPEGGREYNGSELSERVLREIYLVPFEAAVNAGVDTVMPAFNDVNGLPGAANPWLLGRVLREEWSFAGAVVSDWNAVNEIVVHGLAEDRAAAAAAALHAGVDIDMTAHCYKDLLCGLVRNGTVPLDLLDQAVLRVLRLKARLGLFENPFTPSSKEARPLERTLARRMAADSAILLKNAGGALPLSPDRQRLAVLGPLADAKDELLGTWALDGRGSDVVSVTEGIRAKLPPHAVLFEGGRSSWLPFSQLCEAQTVIVVLGEHPLRSGEGGSVTTLHLPPGQEELLESISRSGVTVITVVIAGRPLVLSRVMELSDAVLFLFHPGIEGGNAVADLLFGDSAPQGRLPLTFPRSTGQVPLYYNHTPTGRPADPAVHHTSQYVDCAWTPLLPFGFGLGYTTFEYSDLRIRTPRVAPGETARVSVTVRNSGQRHGTEVAQLYVRDVLASRTRPVRELKGFQKVSLSPGESAELSFDLPTAQLAFFGGNGWVVEPGKFRIGVGSDSSCELAGIIEVVSTHGVP